MRCFAKWTAVYSAGMAALTVSAATRQIWTPSLSGRMPSLQNNIVSCGLAWAPVHCGPRQPLHSALQLPGGVLLTPPFREVTLNYVVHSSVAECQSCKLAATLSPVVWHGLQSTVVPDSHYSGHSSSQVVFYWHKHFERSLSYVASIAQWQSVSPVN